MSETVDPPASASPAPAPRVPAAPPAPAYQEPAPAAPAPSRHDLTAELRAEAAARRIQARDLQDRLDQAEAARAAAVASLDSERAKAAEKASAPLTARLEKMNQRLIDASVSAALTAAGLRDPDLAVMMSKMPDAPEIKLDDDLNVSGVKAAVEAFKKWKPDYFASASPQPSGGAAAGGGGAPPSPPPATTGTGGDPAPSGHQPIVDVRAMSKPDYAKWKAAELAKFRTLGTAGFGR